MSGARVLIAGLLVAGAWLGPAWAADLGTITFTRSTGMGVSAAAGQNTLIRNVNQTGTQCTNPPGGACSGNGSTGTFTNTSDPFFTGRIDCSAANTLCQARFDPGLPDAFDTLPIGGTQFGASGVPCGSGDPNFDPNTGFPYDCNSAGTIYQVVPKGLLDVRNPDTPTCSSLNTSIAGPGPAAQAGASPSNTCTVSDTRDSEVANIRHAPPGNLIVGAPFQVYSSYKSGTRRIHHIEDGLQQAESGPNSGAEGTSCNNAGGGTSCGGVTRQLFIIDVVTDATGHITDDGTGNIRANGTYILEMDDQHVNFFCQVPVRWQGNGTNTAAQQSAGLGSFRSGDDLSPAGAGLMIAANGRKDCFDGGGNPCPTGRVLDTRNSTFCPGDSFPGP